MRKLWGGFVDGRLDIRNMDTGFGGFGSAHSICRVPAVFASKKRAREEYDDVREVEIATTAEPRTKAR